MEIVKTGIGPSRLAAQAETHVLIMQSSKDSCRIREEFRKNQLKLTTCHLKQDQIYVPAFLFQRFDSIFLSDAPFPPYSGIIILSLTYTDIEGRWKNMGKNNGKESKKDLLNMTVDLAKVYASGCDASPEQIVGVLEIIYTKLLELSKKE